MLMCYLQTGKPYRKNGGMFSGESAYLGMLCDIRGLEKSTGRMAGCSLVNL